jgi:hypothetical protein
LALFVCAAAVVEENWIVASNTPAIAANENSFFNTVFMDKIAVWRLASKSLNLR